MTDVIEQLYQTRVTETLYLHCIVRVFASSNLCLIESQDILTKMMNPNTYEAMKSLWIFQPIHHLRLLTPRHLTPPT